MMGVQLLLVRGGAEGTALLRLLPQRALQAALGRTAVQVLWGAAAAVAPGGAAAAGCAQVVPAMLGDSRKGVPGALLVVVMVVLVVLLARAAQGRVQAVACHAKKQQADKG